MADTQVGRDDSVLLPTCVMMLARTGPGEGKGKGREGWGKGGIG